MEEKKRLCGYYNYTVVLTYLGMLAGFTGITFAMEGAYRQTIICLMAAGICDMFDGAVAAEGCPGEEVWHTDRFLKRPDLLWGAACAFYLPDWRERAFGISGSQLLCAVHFDPVSVF